MASADTVEVIAMDPPVTVLPIVPPLSVVHCCDLSIYNNRITILVHGVSTDSETQSKQCNSYSSCGEHGSSNGDIPVHVQADSSGCAAVAERCRGGCSHLTWGY